MSTTATTPIGAHTAPDDAAGTAPPDSEHRNDVETLSEGLFGGAIGAIELATIHIGLRLGLYRSLQEQGPATSTVLADRTDLDERYLREWLEQQAVAQLLACQDDRVAARERVYALPPATAEVLLDPASPAFLGPLATLAVGTILTIDDLERAFRSGDGVAFSRYGSAVRHGLGQMNGATFDRGLAGWIAAMPDIDERLRTGDAPAILDLGCGVGRSSVALARAFPHAVVRGIDLDVASVQEAREAAAAAGVADRVTFAVADAAGPDTTEGAYDLVTMFETLHDMGDPVGALAASRRRLREGGAVLIADQLTRDAYTADGDPLERFQYGCSVLHCLPATRAEDHVVAHGTVIRAQTVDEWAREAGFSGSQILAIADPFWRFYRL